MQTVIPGEDGRQRENRAHREHQAALEVIARRDADNVMGEAEKFALRQIRNKNMRIPLDYAGIIKFRAVEPGLFTLLPTDAECRKVLGRKGNE